MATSTLLSLLLLSFMVATASARPCKTLFYFSATTTTTFYPSNSLDRNPNDPNYLRIPNPRSITLIFTTTTTTTTAAPRFPHHHPRLDFNRFNDNPQSSSSDSPLKLFPSVSSSVRDRTMDILSVVGALLFGVGCGAITAAVMYSVWALCNSRGVDFDDVSSSSDDDADDDEDAIVAKKLGYVSIPTQAKVVDDDIKKPAPPAKEVV